MILFSLLNNVINVFNLLCSYVDYIASLEEHIRSKQKWDRLEIHLLMILRQWLHSKMHKLDNTNFIDEKEQRWAFGPNDLQKEILLIVTLLHMSGLHKKSAHLAVILIRSTFLSWKSYKWRVHHSDDKPEWCKQKFPAAIN
jgi:hypothetical protein